jgi:electron transfer flavoprotein beta subunit
MTANNRYHSVVCVKQVPDTQNLSGEAMKEDGTVNRSALPAIVNPEDLNALEMALSLKDREGGTVTALTMGPPSASEALRSCLYRGADRAILLSDRKFAASDTLATSYVLSCAISQLGDVDFVFCGRQAIDGDTAQIGPQLAQKLELPQVTYVEDIQEVGPGEVKLRRGFERGYEICTAPVPLLITVRETANEPRPPAAKRMMKYKKARTPEELEEEWDDYELELFEQKGLLIEQWGVDEAECDVERCGLGGSPTRVKNIDSVQLVSQEHEQIEPTPQGMDGLVKKLQSEHIFD